MTMTPHDIRMQLLRNGYTPLPVEGKRAVLPNWQSRKVSQKDVAWWGEGYPKARETGIQTGAVVGLDLDILHPEAADELERAIREWFENNGTVLVRFGLAPKRLIPLRTDKPFRKIVSAFTDPNKLTSKPPKIEVLGDGQQFVAFGKHPDTGKNYFWAAGQSLLTTPAAELPLTNEADIVRLINHLSDVLAEQFSFVPTNSYGGADEFETKPTVDVDKELAGIAYGGTYGIHETWKRCAGSLLRKGVPADEAFRRLLGAAESSPACQNDPQRDKWASALASIFTWYCNDEPEFILNLATRIQERWREVASRGEKPRLIWRDDHGLQVRKSRLGAWTKQRSNELRS